MTGPANPPSKSTDLQTRDAPPSHADGGYTHQRSRLSLQDGLAQYHRDHPGLKRGPALSVDAQAFFRSHDVVHVLYGCGTSLPDEAVVKLASVFGTTAGLSVLAGYRLHDAQDIYRRLTVSEVLTTIAKSFVLAPRTILRCRRQHKLWPWFDHDGHLGRPLCELREEFGVSVVRS